MSRLLLGLVCAMTIACSAVEPDDHAPDGGDEPVPGAQWMPLVDADMWRQTPSEEDPLLEHRAGTIMCPETAWHPELGGLEVETTACAYLSLDQPLLHDLASGDVIRLVAWWQSLVSVDPTEGHLAVVIDDTILWEERVAIPGPADARDLEITIESSFPAGSTVTFHLHNHGFNSWNLNELSLRMNQD